MTEMQPARTCLAIILAAGEGTRMKSARPKVLHEMAGRSLLGHALAAVSAAGADSLVVVIGPDRPDVAAEVSRLAPHARIAVQAERKGTAHAVLAARASLAEDHDDVLVAFADTPLVRPETYAGLRQALRQGAGVAALGFEARDPSGYGRFVTRDGQLEAIVEHKDADAATRAIRLCNAGLMALDGKRALAILEAIGNANAQNEYYLTDAVEVARRQGLTTIALIAPEAEVQGVNDRAQLAGAEADFQKRRRLEAMASGLPIVATDVGSNSELIAAERTGIIVPAGDVVQLADALAGLIRRPARCQALGVAARRRAVDEYSLDRMVQNYESVYERLAGRRLVSAVCPTAVTGDSLPTSGLK